MSPDPILRIRNLSKRYESGLVALDDVSLDIRRGEIFALLGPNGAGKTTLISIICGIVTASGGTVHVAGHDIRRDYKASRAMIGLVPQELTTDAFEKVWDTVSLSRGMFGLPPSPAHLEKTLKALSLWDKRSSQIIALSGGMKRRVLIAKALSHEPDILFLDEPTAGVDVTLRREMWQLVHRLRATGVTIILTTHYIEEAEEMADRIGVIRDGRLLLAEQKHVLIKKLGRKELCLQLASPVQSLPDSLRDWPISLQKGGSELHYCFNPDEASHNVETLLRALVHEGIRFTDLDTRQRSLEEIFVSLLEEQAK